MSEPERSNADLTQEGAAILAAAAARGLVVRAVGGLGVWLLCPAARAGPFVRDYKDLDLMGRSRDHKQIAALLEERGYTPDEEFNMFQGAARLLYLDRANGRTVNVFLDQLDMCHTLRLENRLELAELTLAPADLLLTKLQIFQTNERDYLDALALLADTTIDGDRIAEVLANDWGWWRTATEVLEKVRQYGTALPVSPERDRALAALMDLEGQIEAAPRSRKWKLRARVGERVQWYTLPEELGDVGRDP